MNEREVATALAKEVLKRADTQIGADPDDDIAILARQFLRSEEREEQLRKQLAGRVKA